MISQRRQPPGDTLFLRSDRRRLGRAAGSLLLGGLAARSLGPLAGPVQGAAARTDDGAAGSGGLLDLVPETPEIGERPWTEIFAGWTIEPVADAPGLVHIRLTPRPDGRYVWARLWFGGTPGFLAWG